jgi:DNA-binding NtrC family response regulator
MRKGSRVLVVDDESSVTDALKMILTEESCGVSTASDGSEAKKLLDGPPFDLVFTDLRLPDISGIDLISHIKAENPETEVILMTAHGSLEVTIEAIKRGAYYYIEKPFTPDQVIMLAERASEFGKIRQENKHLKRKLAGEGDAFGMIGRTPQMLEIYETIRATAKSDAPVLIEGESGTGKELISTAFHTESNRADRPFIRINCAAIPHDLIESELFGYKKGAFTGADRDKRGLIEATAGGTLLLDEIAEMPVHLQTKLLRVLQERKLRRLGDEHEIDVDFRLVSATNRETVEATEDGALRQDLYFRISTIKVKVPPLRERYDDLALLAERFLMRFSEKYKKSIQGLSQPAFAMLSRYDWPGNIRELESVMERAVLFCQSTHIEPVNFPEQVQGTRPSPVLCVIPPFMTLEELEREAIAQTLERAEGNVKKTAEILNLHRPTLYRKLKKFGLRDNDESESDNEEVSE